MSFLSGIADSIEAVPLDPMAALAKYKAESITGGAFISLSDSEQQDYYASRSREIVGHCTDAPFCPVDLGQASFSEILCKLWQWIVGAAKAIVDGIREVLIDIAHAVFEVLAPILEGIVDIGTSLLSKPLVWLLLIGGAAYFLLSDNERKDDHIIATYPTGAS